MNKELRNALLGGVALAGAGLMVAPEAMAQTAALPGGVTPVQQSAARADAASFDSSTTATLCTTSQTTSTGFTITPPAGNYVYLTSLTAQVGTNGTGAANSQAAITATNIVGSPAWLVAEGASAAIQTEMVNQVFPTGLKSQTPGTTVVFAQGASLGSAFVCIQASGYYSPL